MSWGAQLGRAQRISRGVKSALYVICHVEPNECTIRWMKPKVNYRLLW
jgi:hypothetical protein